MKKFLFSAVACIAFGGLSFANNSYEKCTYESVIKVSVVENYVGCVWRVAAYDKDGNLLAVKNYTGKDDAFDCLTGALAQVKEYQAKFQGATISYTIGGSE